MVLGSSHMLATLSPQNSEFCDSRNCSCSTYMRCRITLLRTVRCGHSCMSSLEVFLSPAPAFLAGKRLGFAVSESAATLEAGTKILTSCFSVADDGAVAVDAKKLGVADFVKALHTPDGESFLQVIEYLNGANAMDRNREDIAEAMTVLHGFLTDELEAKVKAARRMAKTTARLYLCSMEMLEFLTLLGSPEVWATHFKGHEALASP